MVWARPLGQAQPYPQETQGPQGLSGEAAALLSAILLDPWVTRASGRAKGTLVQCTDVCCFGFTVVIFGERCMLLHSNGKPECKIAKKVNYIKINFIYILNDNC